jgi:integrase
MLDYVDRDGRRRQISLGHADKRQAERQRHEKEMELRTHNVAEPISMRLKDFFQDSLARTKRQVRASTLSEITRSLNRFMECIGNIDVQDVRYGHGERFIQHCLAHNVSAATTAKQVKHLKRVFQLAEDRGQLDLHPLRRLKSPKFPKQKIRVYTDDECRKLLEVARQYEANKTPVRWRLLIQMCLDTGMRRGELLNTTWRDIDFAGFTVDVSPKKNCVNTWEWHIKDTERRRLPLTAELVKLLVEHKDSQPKGNPYVFVPNVRYERIQESRRAGRWTVDAGRCPLGGFSPRFRRIRYLANVESGTFHDLRRTCLSNWVTQGLTLHEVKELAGHASIETTERFYLAVRKDFLDRARAASEASRKGESVAHLLRAATESDRMEELLCVSSAAKWL